MINGIYPYRCLVKIRRACGFCLFVVLAGTDLAFGAQNNQELPPPDVRLVIDISGSMKQNDPDNLRQPAVELLLQLLPNSSKAGIWTFGQQVNMLVPHKPVTAQWRREAGQQTSGTRSVGLYTNIGGALEKAAYDMNRPDSHYRTSIILLTDGMVDIDREAEVNRDERRRIVEEILPAIASAGYRIHTIALSDNADRELMDKLSIATDGIAATAHSAEDLMRIFLKAFDAAVPSEQVPLEQGPSGSRFVIDSSIKEFTALVFHREEAQSVTLTSPDKQTYHAGLTGENIKWYHADYYDLITVKLPLEGQWWVNTPSNSLAPESRVTVIGNLNLRVTPLPRNLSIGDGGTLVFQLDEQRKTITRPEFLSLLNSNVELVDGETQHSVWRDDPLMNPPPANGVYQVSLPQFEHAGLHRLTLLVDGKSFTRKFTHDFNIRPQVAPEVVEPAEAIGVEVAGIDAEVEAVPSKTAPAKPQEKQEATAVPPTTTVVHDRRQENSVPAWLVYAAIALVNILILAGAFFAYRLIMNDGKTSKKAGDDPAGEAKKDENKNTDNLDAVAELRGDKTEPPEDEEPPMDDLDSAINELSEFPELTSGNDKK